jgi:hypothetical protein
VIAPGEKATLASSNLEFLDRFHPKGPIEVINFDAHHDLGYNGDDYKADYKPNCGNWAMQLLRQNRLQKYTLVYPEWRKAHPEPGSAALIRGYQKHLPDRILVNRWKAWLKLLTSKRKIDGLFICRSGPWVPPCYDGDFNDMVRFLTGTKEAIAQRATSPPPDPNTMEGVLASLVK